MALRAGYYGVKGNLISVISKLAGAKIIKTIGDGLKLTTAGKLSCDIDADTMEFKNGKLAAKSKSWDYSTNEVNTGQKWIDGKDIFCKVLTFENAVSINANTWYDTTEPTTGIDKVVDIKAGGATNVWRVGAGFDSQVLGVLNYRNSTISIVWLAYYYTKSASE